jgi:ATP-binding cassette subfamily B protein
VKFRDVFVLLKPYRKRMAFIMVLAVVIAVVSAVTPFVNQNMIDLGLLQGNVKVVVTLVLLILVLQIGSRLLEYLQQKQEIEITNLLGEELKTKAFEHGLRLKPHYYKENTFYKTMSDAIYDISMIMSIANSSFFTIFVVICKCVGAAVGLFILDWRLAIFVLCLMPIKLLINNKIRKRAEKLGKNSMDVNKKYNSWYSNIINGIVDIKVWNMEKKTTAEFDEHVRTMNDASKKMSLMQAMNTFITQSLEHIISYSLYIIGAFLIAGNQLTFGGLIAFISFTSYVLLPVNVILSLRVILKQISPSVEGIKRFNSMEEENYDSDKPIENGISSIEFRDVSISLGDREILSNLNFTVNRGEKIAVVGENGSGKTTLINLLLRFYEPSKGGIYINGAPAEAYNVTDYRKHFSVVMQDIHLFKGTVMDNISLGHSGINSVIYDPRLRFCTDTIEGWDRQYETEIGSDGMKLSGGERQKVALLRALSRRSDILILDEPTSNYDMESEEQFNEFIESSLDYNFVFIITHRKEILDKVDKILTVHDGVVDIS